MSRHEPYSPSRLALLEACPGFLSSGVSSEAATRGTSIHKLIETIVNGELVEVPEEHEEAVSYALAVVDEARHRLGLCEVHTEVWLQGQVPGTSGTADLVVVNEFDGHCILIDWKTGWSERKPPADNLQLLTYAAAAAGKWSLDTIELWLVEIDKQTRQEAIFDAYELCKETLPRVIKTIKAARECSEQDYRPNNACKWCVREVTCPAIRKELHSIELAGQTTTAALTLADPKQWIETLDPMHVSEFLSAWKRRVEFAANVVKHVEGRAFSIIKAGGEVPGWTLANGRKTRKWADEDAAVKALSEAGIDALELRLKSPAQVEKLGKDAKRIVSGLVREEHSERLEEK